MAYPIINLKQCDYAQITQNKTGDLAMVYKPLQNLVKDFTLGGFTTENLNFDRYNYQDMLITDEFDGSTNIILNDDTNAPQLINSGFSVQEDNTFLIPEHYTNVVDNIYEDTQLSEDVQLLKLYKSIPSVRFDGLGQGSFKCGSYVFYFRLSDSHGNMSNVVQHSSIVQIHVGETNTYKVRMGMQDENSNKSVYFTLENIDSGFDYIRVFYERTSTANDMASSTLCYMIDQNFPITNGKCEICLTGEEPAIGISMPDLKNEYADVASCKTHAIVDNVLFLGNTSADVHDYKALQHIAWSIFVEQLDSSIPLPDPNALGTATGYYNMKNVYSKVGYWPDEYYRFGIVFVYNSNQLSPVFNIQGYDLQAQLENGKKIQDYIYNKIGTKYEFYDSEPEDYFFNKSIYSNSKGVVRLRDIDYSKVTKERFNLVNLKFNLEGLQAYLRDSQDITDSLREQYCVNSLTQTYDIPKFLNQVHGIKGFFFVRQKRIPTIIAQGMVVGLTKKDHGSIPILQDQNVWKTKSFLNSSRLVLSEGTSVEAPNENVYCKALLVPDAELQEATFNQIFSSQEFALYKQGSLQFKVHNNCTWWEYSGFSPAQSKLESLSQLTAVPKETKVITNGKDFFSTVAGTPEEAFKTEDVRYKWNKTVPQDLTKSTSLIRGRWGYYVGMSTEKFSFGDIVNIKTSDFIKNPENQNLLEFQSRFYDSSFYSPISTRYPISILEDTTPGIECFGGDCFPSMFTHRMMTNFVDPELPTNTKIIDPGCWAKNYAVRCTAELLSSAHSNLTGDSAGFYIPSPKNKASKILSLIFGILTGNLASAIKAAINLASKEETPVQDDFANEIAQAFEVYIGGPKDENDIGDPLVDGGYMNGENEEGKAEDNGWSGIIAAGKIKKVNPAEQEQNASGFNLKALFKSDQNWELHGLAQINRADINAVSLGQWITFPIMSSMNLALRDVDFNNTTEEAKFNKKRGFYPLEAMDITSKLPDSNVINGAAKKTIHKNTYPAYKTVPFRKQEYFNRIYWSKPNVSQAFLNSFRLIYSDQYKEYNKEFGTITKILPLGNSLFVCFTHGMGVLPIDKSIKSETEASPYLASRNVLPSQVTTLSRDFGSMWKNSVIQSPSGIIYGVDTVAKKIWRTQGSSVEFISDHKVTKFLNDFLELSEFDYQAYQGHLDVKTHYNNFKNDVIFTFVKDVPTYDVPSEEKLEELRQYMRQMWCAHQNDQVYFGKYEPGEVDGNGTMAVIFGTKATSVKKNGRIVGDSFDYSILNGFDWASVNTKGITSVVVGSDTYSFEVPYTQKKLEVQSGKVYVNDLFSGVRLDIKSWSPGVVWSLCFNEKLNKFITFYDWYPIESCNVDNIYFSFNQEDIDHIYNKEITKDIFYPTIKVSTGSSSTSELKYQISNKYFIDRTFSDKVHIYRLEAGSTHILNTNNEQYMSFYYRFDTTKSGCDFTYSSGVIDDYRPYFVSLPLEEGWSFAVLQLNTSVNSITLNPTGGYMDVTEVKTFTKLPIDSSTDQSYTSWDDYAKDTRKDIPRLHFYEIRDYNPGRMYLWKHGQAGVYDNQGDIKPTNWYGRQHEFNFEFIVNDVPMRQKIFNNLKIISNKAQPNKFEYEIVGEGYEWWHYKPVVYWANKKVEEGVFSDLSSAYKWILSDTVDNLRSNHPDFPITDLEYRSQDIITPYQYLKLPYLQIELTDRQGRRDKSYHKTDVWSPIKPVRNLKPRVYDYSFNTNETVIKYDKQLNEYRLHDEQLGNDMWKYGRVRGNMQYLEDMWDVEIRPINFKWCYMTKPNHTVTSESNKFSITYDTNGLVQSIDNLFGLTTTLVITNTDLSTKSIQFNVVHYKQGQPATVSISSQSFTQRPQSKYTTYTVKVKPGEECHIQVVGASGITFPSIEEDFVKLVKPELQFKKASETRHRDKYIKVKIRYSGEDLALIQQIYTIFDESYA